MILKHLFFFNVADQMQKPQTGRTRGLETVHVEEQGTGQQSRRATTLLIFFYETCLVFWASREGMSKLNGPFNLDGTN